MTHLDIITAYLQAGLSIIPIKRDGSKQPLVPWATYQERRATEAELGQWIAAGVEGWGLVCGAISGNVEVIDFDDPALFGPWHEQIDDELLSSLVVAQTPSGGYHIIYRCAEIEPNQKLARRPAEGSPPFITTIETRGEGGQILVWPTTEAYHPAGKPYLLLQGDLLNIPKISPADRALLLDAARVLNEYFPAQLTYEHDAYTGGNGHDSGDFRPGDDFAERVDWAEILEPAGWRAIRKSGDRIIWQRPGKDGPGGSAQTGGKSQRTGFSGLYVYSTNAYPFEADRGYGKFHAYAMLEHDGDFSAAARELAKQGYGRQVIVRERQAPSEQPIEIPDTMEELLGAEVPALPIAARLDPSIGHDACHWLDAYVALSRQWSPRAFDDFHSACALWLLSTVAARRVCAHLGGPRYSNLYIALVARTSLWAKSTTAKIVSQTLREAGLTFLLAPDDSTPQRFISDLVLRPPADWDSMGEDARQAAMRRMAFPAARGWFYEELGMKLDAMLAKGGFMADFRGILRAFDDCPEEYTYSSIGRGEDRVQRPYVAMLGNMTPSDMQRATRQSAGLWQDGFWARWAFVTPPGDMNSSRARFPHGERTIPSEIVQPIRCWHERLGIPKVEIEPRRDADGKSTGSYEVFAGPTVRTHVEIDKDAAEAFYAYHDGLLDVVEKLDNRDFDGNYARFAEKALRVAMLIGSLEHGDRITLAVWARAQEIAERWRRSLHELYEQAQEPPASEAVKTEETVLRIIGKLNEATPTQVARYMWGMSSGEMAHILENMVQAGALVRSGKTHKGTFRYAIADDENE